MVVKADQERIKTLLKDTITLLCRNGLTFKTEFSIEALIGITLDKDDIFLVNINEIIRTELGNKLAAAADQSDEESIGDAWEDGSADDVSHQGTPHSSSRKKRRKRPRSSGSQRNDGGGGDVSNTSFPGGDDSSTHSEPPMKRPSSLPNSRNSVKHENDDDSKDIVFIKEEVDTGEWPQTNQGHSNFSSDISGIQSQNALHRQQENFDSFLQSGSLVPVGAQQAGANLWSEMTGGPGSSMNQSMSPPGAKRSSTITSNATGTPGDDSQQDVQSDAGLLMEADDGESCGQFMEQVNDDATTSESPVKLAKRRSGRKKRKKAKTPGTTKMNKKDSADLETMLLVESTALLVTPDEDMLATDEMTVIDTSAIDDKPALDALDTPDSLSSNVPGSKASGFLCHLCPMTFTTKASMKRHTKKHNGVMLQCPSCPKKYYEKHELRNHISTNHSGILWRCTECDKSFRSKIGLTRHSQGHSGTYKYNCAVCGQGFAYHHLFIEHSNMHIGHKPYKCHRCSVAFYRKRELSFHVGICGKAPSIECEECGKKFKARKYLLSHMQNHVSPGHHQCAQCGMVFSHRGSLRNHEKRKHVKS